MLLYMQCRFPVQPRRYQHERDRQQRRERDLALSRHLPLQLRNQRRVLSIRRSAVQDEMGIVDVRRVPG